MKILITGSNGIIGRQLLIQLLDTYPEAEFTVINRSSVTLVPNERIKILELDLLNIDKSKSDIIFNEQRPDLFFHLAWDTGHGDYLNTLNNINWEKTSIILIDSFYNSGGKKFIGIGSSIEYNWQEDGPFDEFKSSLSGNNWLYGQSKVRVYNYLTSLPKISYLWCRVFFVFGPGQTNSRLVPVIINNAINGGDPLTINLELKRDYISTMEIARQIIMMQKINYTGAVNICSGEVVRLGDLVGIIEKHTNKKISISHNKFQDSFEIESIGAKRDLINKYYPEYSYSFEDLELHMIETINTRQV